MNQTMRRIPIEFVFDFLTKKTECDSAEEWKRSDVRWNEKSCNKPYEYVEPISYYGLVGLKIKIRTDDNDFIFYDENGNRIKKCDDETAIHIEEYKNNFVLKNMFYGNEIYFINQFNLSQAIFDLETWLVDNLNDPFVFVLGIVTERQLQDGYSFLRAWPCIAFSDETDAMAYILKYS